MKSTNHSPNKILNRQPQPLPLCADLMIGGIQKEYILPTKRSVIEGDTMTRSMKDRNMNIVSPGFFVRRV